MLKEIQEFFEQSHRTGGLTEVQNELIKTLWDGYKLNTIEEGCSIISAEFGRLGSLIIREVESVNIGDETLEYLPGDYNYVCIVAKTTKYLLWTDFSIEEPYNRQGGLYCGGMSWALLKQVAVHEEYREFEYSYNYPSKICFGIWGYNWNDYYKSLTFGICLKTNQVDEFIGKLRKIINK